LIITVGTSVTERWAAAPGTRTFRGPELDRVLLDREGGGDAHHAEWVVTASEYFEGERHGHRRKRGFGSAGW
jgi:hypothetical protein